MARKIYVKIYAFLAPLAENNPHPFDGDKK